MIKANDIKYVVALGSGLVLVPLFNWAQNVCSNLDLFEALIAVSNFFETVEQIIQTAFTG